MEVTARFDTKNLQLVELKIIKENGFAERKTISFVDFNSIINSSTKESDSFHIGKLPAGFYDGIVSIKNSSTFQFVIEIPAARRNLSYYGDNYIVPFPRFVFYFAADAGKITKTKIFAVSSSEQKLTDDSVLYHYPFGNVYDDGHICWGNNVLEPVYSYEDVWKFILLFFGSETNDDLFKSGKFHSQRAMIEYLKNLENFPEKYLRKQGKKVGELLK